MLRLLWPVFRKVATRNLATRSQHNLKVAICGAAGQCGEMVALSLKLSAHIDELSLYDVMNTRGLSVELGHIDTNCQVCLSSNKLRETLEHSRIVVVVASVPGSMPADLLRCNAGIVYDLVSSCAQFCPNAVLVVATNPLNSMVPIASRVLKKYGVYNPNRVLGVTKLNAMRTNVLVAQCHGLPVDTVHVPVIGGHSVDTVVPVLSQTRPASEFTSEELERITQQVRQMNDFMEERRYGESVLSGALAVSRFVISLARAMKGEKHVEEYAFVKCNAYPHVEYLTSRIELGIDGVQRHLGLPKLSEYEKCLLHNAVTVLIGDIKYGEDFVSTKAAKCERICSQ